MEMKKSRTRRELTRALLAMLTELSRWRNATDGRYASNEARIGQGYREIGERERKT